jgi:hypothetical protein
LLPTLENLLALKADFVPRRKVYKKIYHTSPRQPARNTAVQPPDWSGEVARLRATISRLVKRARRKHLRVLNLKTAGRDTARRLGNEFASSPNDFEEWRIYTAEVRVIRIGDR